MGFFFLKWTVAIPTDMNHCFLPMWILVVQLLRFVCVNCLNNKIFAKTVRKNYIFKDMLVLNFLVNFVLTIFEFSAFILAEPSTLFGEPWMCTCWWLIFFLLLPQNIVSNNSEYGSLFSMRWGIEWENGS